LFFVYRFQWIKTFCMGVAITYAIHAIGIAPKLIYGYGMYAGQYGLDFFFLTSYWLLFVAGTHLAQVKDTKLVNFVSTTNFINVLLYLFFAQIPIEKLFLDQKYLVVIGIGLVYLVLALMIDKTERRKLYVSDIVTAAFCI